MDVNNSVFVQQGSHTFTVNVGLINDADVVVAAGSSLTFNNVLNLNGNTLTTTDPGTMNLDGTVNTGTDGSIVVAGGTVNIDAGGSIVVTGGGVLGGTGTISGDLTNSGGTVSPGLSPGTLSITGNYVQETSSSLLIEIDGTAGGQFDVLNVTNTLTINGGSLDLVTGFPVVLNDSFDILNFSSATGAFDAINGTPGAGLVWDTDQLFVDGTITAILAAVLGDFNGDFVVNTADFDMMRANWLTAGHALNTNGEVTGDGIVDLDDFSLFKDTLFAGGTSSAQASAVPEPNSFVLMLAIVPAWLACRSRRKMA